MASNSGSSPAAPAAPAPAPAGTASGTYVFRLTQFDAHGNKLAKRKYGYPVKDGAVKDLDKTVYEGIVARAESTFSLTPGKYGILLCERRALEMYWENPKPSAPANSVKELGTDDLKAPKRAISCFAMFAALAAEMETVAFDAKNRKVVNLCIVPVRDDPGWETPSPPTAQAAASVASAQLNSMLEQAKQTTRITENLANKVTSPSPPGPAAPVTPPAAPFSVAPFVDAQSFATSIAQASSDLAAQASSNAQRLSEDIMRSFPPLSHMQAGAPVKGSWHSSSADDRKNEAQRRADQNRAKMVEIKLAMQKRREAALELKKDSAEARDKAKEARKAAAEQQKAAWHAKMQQHRQSLSQQYSPASKVQASPPKPDMSARVDESDDEEPKSDTKAVPRMATSEEEEMIAAYERGMAAFNRSTKPAPAAAGAPPAYGSAERAKHYPAYAPAQKPARQWFTERPKVAQELAGADRKRDYYPAYSAEAAGKAWFEERPKSAREVADELAEQRRRAKPFYNYFHQAMDTPTPGSPADGVVLARFQGPKAGAEPVVLPGQLAAPSGNGSNAKFDALKASFETFADNFYKSLGEAFAESDSGSAAVVLEGEGEKAATSARPQSTETVRPASEEKEKHNASCDVCDAFIEGDRYKCLSCPDWDCCSKCAKTVEAVHPGHSFAVLHKKEDLVRPPAAASRAARHVGIHCDGCNRPLYGVRYKCTHASCPDFDLCATCEADPEPYTTGRKTGNHDWNTHLLLKIREPVKQGQFGFSGPSPAERARKETLVEALYNAKKFLEESSTVARQEGETKQKNTIKLAPGPKHGEQTLTLDVDLPFGILNGDHEISIPLRLGKNDKNESIVLGLAETFAEGFKNLIKPQVELAPEQEQEQEQAAGEPLNATWLSDVTFPDDSSVAPATEFNKIWRVQNSGTRSWPEGTQLVCVSGFGKSATGPVAAYDVAQAAPGEQVLVTARDVAAPDTPGKHTSYYRFVTPDGTRFGDRLWVALNVEEMDGSLHSRQGGKSSGSASSSLGNSSVIAPALSVRNGNDVGSAITSPRTTASELPSQAPSVVSTPTTEEEDGFVLLSDEDDFAEAQSVNSSRR